MKIKKGIVMEIDKNKTTLLTKTGEFVEVKIKSSIPKLGEEYSGAIYTPNKIFKYPLIAAFLMFVLFMGNNIYAYYTPVASITISINPSLKIEINKWNKIIETSALNKDGETLLKNLNIKNKLLKKGLNEIVEQAKKDKFITKAYIDSNKIITLTINTNKDMTVDVSEFKSFIEKNNLKVVIQDSTTKKSAIPANKSKDDKKNNNEKEKINETDTSNSNNTNNINKNDINKNHNNDKKIHNNSNNSSTKDTNVNNSSSTKDTNVNNKSFNNSTNNINSNTNSKNNVTKKPNSSSNHDKTEKNKQPNSKKEDHN